MAEKTLAGSARWACAYFFAINGLVHGSLMARIPALKMQAGLDEGTLGQALLCLGLGALTAFPLTGILQRWLGSRRIVIGGGLLLLFAFPLVGLAYQWLSFALAMYLIGLASGAMDVAVNTQSVEVERALRRPTLSLLHGMYSLGGLVGALGAAALVALSPVWHFILLAVIALIFLLPGGKRLLPDEHMPARTHKGSGLRLPPMAVVGLGLMALCSFVSEGAIADWSALLLHDVKNASEGLSALGYAAFSATMVFGRLFGDRLRVRFQDHSLVRALGGLATLGMVVALLAPDAIISIIGFALAGLGLSIIVPILFSAAGNRPGIDPGVGVAAVATLGYGGLLMGPPLIGLLAQAVGLKLALLSIVALCAALCLRAGIVRRG